MAVNQPTDFSPNNILQDGSSIQQYIDLGQYINEVNMPDNRERLVMTYGDQAISGLYGLLYMVGAINASGSNDSIQWWEDTRLHNTADGVVTTTAVTAGVSTSVLVTLANHKVREKDVVLIYKGNSVVRTQCSATTSTTFTLQAASVFPISLAVGETISASIVFNTYAQGTNQPTDYIESNIVKRTNSYIILKDIYTATGSAMTNRAWVEIDGKRQFYWKGEQDMRKRYMDFMEMGHLLGESYTNSTLTSAGLDGTEGYFSALESRGTVHGGFIETLDDIEDLGEALDQEGGAVEYAGYASNTQLNKISRMLAALSNGATPSYGMFNNSKEMAMELDFHGFHHGGRNFYFHNWKLMNDKQLLGKQDVYKGVLVPMDTIKDSKTGTEAPLLEINYKNEGGYSRELETWNTGAVNGVYNDSNGFDGMKWNVRAEQALATRAANRHVLIK